MIQNLVSSFVGVACSTSYAIIGNIGPTLKQSVAPALKDTLKAAHSVYKEVRKTTIVDVAIWSFAYRIADNNGVFKPIKFIASKIGTSSIKQTITKEVSKVAAQTLVDGVEIGAHLTKDIGQTAIVAGHAAAKEIPKVGHAIEQITKLYNSVFSIKSQHLIGGGLVAAVAGYGVYRFFNPVSPAASSASTSKGSTAPPQGNAQQDQINAVLIQELQNLRGDLEAQKALQYGQPATSAQQAAPPIHIHLDGYLQKAVKDLDSKENKDTSDFESSKTQKNSANIQTRRC